jgi:DNA-directed RNA polymerase specialized sigma24 family protein
MDVSGESGSDLNSRAAPLEILLQRLALDKEVAPGYEQLRMRLITFFRLRFPTEAESLADEAIDRLARRLMEGTRIDNLTSYAVGIARFLVLETATRQKKEKYAAHEAMRDLELQPEDLEAEATLQALRQCLDSTGTDSAQLILEYYAADGGATRIGRRQQLAQRLGMTLNTLRNRALRTRAALEACVRARLAVDSTNLGGDIPSKTDTRGRMQHSSQRSFDDAND